MNFIYEPVELGYNDLEATMDGPRRFYSIAGKNYPSITTCLSDYDKEALQEWIDRVGPEEAERIKKQAARRGKRVHEGVECFVRGIDFNAGNPLVAQGVAKIARVLSERMDRVYGIETALYSDYLRVAGRTDLAGRFDGKRSIIDAKTSRSTRKREWCYKYFMQEAYYAIAWEERTGQPITQLVTIIDADGEKDAQVFIEHRDEWAPKMMEVVAKYKEANGLA